MNNWVKYVLAAVIGGSAVIGAGYFFPEQSFVAFLIGWLFLIPAAFVVYLAYGLWKYMLEREHRITVAVKPTEAMKAIARREAELMREKELLYEELRKEVK